MSMLKELLSLTFTVMYINNVLRFCFIGVLLGNVSYNLLPLILSLSLSLSLFLLSSLLFFFLYKNLFYIKNLNNYLIILRIFNQSSSKYIFIKITASRSDVLRSNVDYNIHIRCISATLYFVLLCATINKCGN